MDANEKLKEIRNLAQAAKFEAHELYEQLLLTQSFYNYHDFSVSYHWGLAHKSFSDLAKILGYRIEKIEEEADKPAEPVVITEREVYTSDFADALTLGFSQRESRADA